MSKSFDISHLTDADMIVVHQVTENEDGTASVELDLGANTLRLLIELGFCALVKESIKMGCEEKE